MFSCHGASGAECQCLIQRAPAMYSHMRREVGKSLPRDAAEGSACRAQAGTGCISPAWQGEDGQGEPLDTLRHWADPLRTPCPLSRDPKR